MESFKDLTIIRHVYRAHRDVILVHIRMQAGENPARSHVTFLAKDIVGPPKYEAYSNASLSSERTMKSPKNINHSQQGNSSTQVNYKSEKSTGEETGTRSGHMRSRKVGDHVSSEDEPAISPFNLSNQRFVSTKKIASRCKAISSPSRPAFRYRAPLTRKQAGLKRSKVDEYSSPQQLSSARSELSHDLGMPSLALVQKSPRGRAGH